MRDLLIRLAQSGLVQAKWTDEILDEVFRSLRRNRPDLDADRLARTRQLMNCAVRDCLVVDYQAITKILDLPDSDDNHVLAAAIKAHAQVILTSNVKHFPHEALTTWNIEAKEADAFVLDQIYLNRGIVHSAVQQIADSWNRPPGTFEDVLAGLERNGLFESAAALRTSAT
ncbi:PIN domain-containing protein [Actinophytocola sp.]|uniref:PIN domain-containing protein n=1 Tax=Actinophytocola sp. TaxID=1872138 RepID=UPI0039C8846C